MLSSSDQPPSTHSTAEMRMPIGLCAGQTARMAVKISSGSRTRFSNEPPYVSVRLFESGDRNWCSR